VYATKLALPTLGRRVRDLDVATKRLDNQLEVLVRGAAPGLCALDGVGIDTAAILIVAAGDNPQPMRSEAAFAHLCGVAPIEASSGKTIRHRLNRGGNRQANHALWRIVFTRMSSDERTAHTSPDASPRADRNRRSSASSSDTSPARSTSSSGATDTSSR
jgi:transposase